MHLAICLPPRNGVRASSLQLPPGAWGTVLDLRVHMAVLGAPIANDEFYPELASVDARDRPRDDYLKPLKLLAKSLAFIDPISGLHRHFESRMIL